MASAAKRLGRTLNLRELEGVPQPTALRPESLRKEEGRISVLNARVASLAVFVDSASRVREDALPDQRAYRSRRGARPVGRLSVPS